MNSTRLNSADRYRRRKEVITLDDSRIIDLYFERDERAIEATDSKYGRLLRLVAFNILHSEEDSEECVDDTYIKAWGVMPPRLPYHLSTQGASF